jgi:hypothetical protein
MHDNSAGAAVVDQIRVVLREHPRIGRHGNGADLDRAKKAYANSGESGKITKHAILDLDAETL